MRVLMSTGLLAFLVLSGGVSQAAPMAYQFTGVIGWVQDQSAVLDPPVQLGTPFSGEFKFDSDATDANPGPSFGEYRGPSFSMALSIGPYSWFSGAGNGHVNVLKGDVLGRAQE